MATVIEFPCLGIIFNRARLRIAGARRFGGLLPRPGPVMVRGLGLGQSGRACRGSGVGRGWVGSGSGVGRSRGGNDRSRTGGEESRPPSGRQAPVSGASPLRRHRVIAGFAEGRRSKRTSTRPGPSETGPGESADLISHRRGGWGGVKTCHKAGAYETGANAVSLIAAL